MPELIYMTSNFPKFLKEIQELPKTNDTTLKLTLPLLFSKTLTNAQLGSILSSIPPHITAIDFGWVRWLNEFKEVRRKNPFAIGPRLGYGGPSLHLDDRLANKKGAEIKALMTKYLPAHIQSILVNNRPIPRLEFITTLTAEKLPDMQEALSGCNQFVLLANALNLVNKASACLEWGLRLRGSEAAKTLVEELKIARTDQDRNKIKDAFMNNNEKFLKYHVTSVGLFIGSAIIVAICALEILAVLVAVIGAPYGLGLWTALELNAGMACAMVLQGVLGAFALCPRQAERRWFFSFREPLKAVSEAIDQLSEPKNQVLLASPSPVH